MWEVLIVVAVVVAAGAVAIRRAVRALWPTPRLPGSGCAGCAERDGCCAAALTGPQQGPPHSTKEDSP